MGGAKDEVKVQAYVWLSCHLLLNTRFCGLGKRNYNKKTYS